MTKETRNDIKFYVCLGLGFTLMMVSLILPPLNVITSSALIASITLLGLGGLIVGVDLKGILDELVELKKLSIKDIKNDTRNLEKD